MGFFIRIKEIRKARRLTQADLAKSVGATERVIGAWERGETAITLEDAYTVAVALDCTPNDLCGWPRSADPAPALSDGESELLDRWRACSDAGRGTVLAVARSTAAAEGMG